MCRVDRALQEWVEKKALARPRFPLAARSRRPALPAAPASEPLVSEQSEPHPAAFEVERSPAATEVRFAPRDRARRTHAFCLSYTVDQVVYAYEGMCAKPGSPKLAVRTQ